MTVTLTLLVSPEKHRWGLTSKFTEEHPLTQNELYLQYIEKILEHRKRVVPTVLCGTVHTNLSSVLHHFSLKCLQRQQLVGILLAKGGAIFPAGSWTRDEGVILLCLPSPFPCGSSSPYRDTAGQQYFFWELVFQILRDFTVFSFHVTY